MSTDETDPIKRLMALTMSTEKETPAEPQSCVHASDDQGDDTVAVDESGPDWDAIEQDYRAGIFSVRAIGREHGVDPSSIAYRAKKHGWVRNLTDKVRQLAQKKLLLDGEGPRLSIDGDGVTHARAREANEQETIEKAAAAQVAVVRQHRKDLKQLRDLQAKLTEKAEAFFSKQKGREGKAISTLSDLQTAVQTIESLARTVGRTIPLERQAYSLDADRGPNADVSAIEQRIKRYQEAKRADRDNPQAVAQAVKAAQDRGENVTSLEERVARHNNETGPDAGA